MGGASSEVSDATTERPHRGRALRPDDRRARPSRRHRLITEASKRFERGVDPKVTAAAAQLAVDLLVEHGGGTVDPGVTDVDRTTERTAYLLDVTEPARIVGVDYPRERVVGILRDLGCRVDEAGEGADDTHVLVTPPSWRPDLVDAPDYAEEVARIDGYDNIPSITADPERRPRPDPRAEGPPGRRRRAGRGRAAPRSSATRSCRRSSPTSSMLPADDDRRHAVRLANPLSERERRCCARRSWTSLVDTMRRNVARGHTDVAVYEIGLVFRPGGALGTAPIPGVAAGRDADTLEQLYAAVPSQPRRAGILATGQAEQAGWWGPGRAADWSDMAAAVQTVARRPRGPGRRRATTAGHAPWHPGRCARITPRATAPLVGHAGELHPKVVAALDLPPRTVAAEFDVDVLVAASAEPVAGPRRSRRFPPAMTDIALLVASDVAAADVEAALRSGAGRVARVGRPLRRLRGRAHRGGAPVPGLPPAPSGRRTGP